MRSVEILYFSYNWRSCQFPYKSCPAKIPCWDFMQFLLPGIWWSDNEDSHLLQIFSISVHQKLLCWKRIQNQQCPTQILTKMLTSVITIAPADGLWHSDVPYGVHSLVSLLMQSMACRLLDSTPLPGSIITQVKFQSKCNRFVSSKYHRQISYILKLVAYMETNNSVCKHLPRWLQCNLSKWKLSVLPVAKID